VTAHEPVSGSGWYRHRFSGRVAAIAIALAAPALTGVTACSAVPAESPRAASEPAGAALALPGEPWWGGPSYYARFPKAVASGWAEPAFFPIAVFQGKPEHAASLKEIGINTYMGAEHDGSTMSSITRVGISVLAQSEWTEDEVGDDPGVVGWHISDECDMGYSGCEGDEDAQLARQRQYAERARSHQDGRFVQANFGNGVLGTFWSKDTMPDHIALVDVSSVDKYAYTSPHVQELLANSPSWPTRAAPASSFAYGWLQDRMESFSSPAGSKPNWVFVETAKPYLTEGGATSITPAQLEGAVWSAIIHGAAGIAYFQHNNDGCGNYSLVACPQARQAVQRVNASVQALAPVLNTQSFSWTFGDDLSTSLKVVDGQAYVLAMANGVPGLRRFTLPPGVTGQTVEVVGEDRSIRVADQGFSDTFASELSHHVYRIDL